MNEKRVLTIQDISCFGQCSITVALPILSAAGFETAIIPSAVLSTHTGGFKNFTCKDLTSEIKPIIDHWASMNLKFDVIYTGYLASKEQIELVLYAKEKVLKEDGLLIVDPAMADLGKLYPAFDMNFVKEMRKLAFAADIILPNLTEATLLIDEEYKSNYDHSYIEEIIKKLRKCGAKQIVLTGIGYKEGKTGVVSSEIDEIKYYEHEKISKGCHGTGDVFASSFVGALMKGKTLFDSSKIAADYVVECIKNTNGDEDHWYGVKFEKSLGFYLSLLGK